MQHRQVVWSLVTILVVAVAGSGGCASPTSGWIDTDSSTGDAQAPGAGDASCGGFPCGSTKDGGCTGLKCQVTTCNGGAHTTISGRVFDPAGTQPLYNAVVYVPTDPQGKLTPITPGTNTCNKCDATISGVVAATLSDETGSFKLVDVPTGANIPLVVQIGKWRREITVPSTQDCADTPLADGSVRLPRNQSEGDLPQLAILTGGADPLPCLFPRIGIDAAEFTKPSGGGRVHVYEGGNYPAGGGGGNVQGGGAPDCHTTASCPLWSTKPQLEAYDIVVLSCEGQTFDSAKPNKVPMHDWLNEGGKVFATHWQATWFSNGPTDFANVATWQGGVQWAGPYDVNTTFPKGQAFLKWLQYVGAATGSAVPLNQSDVRQSLTTVSTNAQSWISTPETVGPDVARYVSFGTPTSATGPYCGKAVFTDIHIGGATNQDASVVPTTCNTAPLSAQEKALEFLFFDLSSCVQDDNQPPTPPQVN